MLIALPLLLLVLASFSIIQAQDRLDRPTNLQFSNDTLSWDAVDNAGGYRIRWRAGSGSWNTANLPADQTSYDFSDLP